jgi:glycosyltransferase involved in cell wall biosynthesis
MPNPIRVALLSTAVEFGGVDRVVATLVNEVRNGIRFLPILYTRRDVVRHALFDALDAQRLPFERIYIDASARGFPTPLRDVCHTIGALRRSRVDLVHSHGYRADVLGLVAARFLRLPIMATCHGYVFTDRRLGFYNRLDLAALRRFDRVIAVSERLRDDLVHHGVGSRCVETIVNAAGASVPPGVEVTRRRTRSLAAIPDEEIVFGFVGRLCEEKGLAYLLDAAAGLPERGWRVVLVGGGPQRSALESLAAARGLTDRVLFAGFQEDPAAWYAAMDVFVLPSLTEGTPMVLLEAMAFGLPVVATSVGGVPRVVGSGETGVLVPPAEVAPLRAELQALLESAPLRRRLGERGRASVGTAFDVRLWADRMAAAYRSAVRSDRGSAEAAARRG